MPHGYMLPIALTYNDYGIPVVMYDQIGCGESTRFKDRKGDEAFWTPELFVAELENVITKLGIKHFNLLGHSWGATLAALFAIRKQPRGLRRLIISHCATDLSRLAASTMRLRKQMPAEIQDVFDRCDREENVSSEAVTRAMIYAYTLHMCRVRRWPAELLDAMAAMQEDDTVYSTMIGSSALTMKGSLMKMQGLIEDRLADITDKTCPGGMLILSSQHDLVQDDTMTGWFTKPSCRVKWVRFALSSHFAMLEETEAYVSAVGLFLSA